MTKKERTHILDLLAQIAAMVNLDDRTMATHSAPSRASRVADPDNHERMARMRAIQADKRMARRKAKLWEELDKLERRPVPNGAHERERPPQGDK